MNQILRELQQLCGLDADNLQLLNIKINHSAFYGTELSEKRSSLAYKYII
jgi:hypothetical protein